MWIVRLVEQRMPYGPFTDEQEAHQFARYLSAEVDPAVVERLCSPMGELLSWYGQVKEEGR
ncbi:hypothetical protein GCM10023334_028920 [Nonomuraea thailandensis]|nr:hypothetical protein [Nonomuraea thailandensis]